MFYLYTDEDDRFIRIDKDLNIKKTSKIKKAAYWNNIKVALTWKNKVKSTFPNAKLEEFTLIKK